MAKFNNVIVYVEIREGHPHSVITHSSGPHGLREDTYDFDYCKRYGKAVYQGVGTCDARPILAEFDYWASPNVKIIESPGAHRIRKLPKGYRRLSLFSDAIACEGGWSWCRECDDIVDHDELCDHVFCCFKCGVFSTPDEPCGHTASEGTEDEDD